MLIVALASACASQGVPFDEEGPGEIELIVHNERQSATAAYHQWRRGNPTRLGEIGGDSSIMVRIPVRGQELRIFFVNPGQSPGNPREPGYAAVRRGDRFAWTLRADRSVFYLRIE